MHVLRHLPEVERFIDFERARVDWPRLADDRGWSHGEQVLIDTAFSLWSGSEKSMWDVRRGEAAPTQATVSRVIERLDDVMFDVVIEALAIRRGLVPAPVEQ